MSYQPKPNTGTLWNNDRKSSDNHPDVRGDVYVSKELIRKIASNSQGDMLKISVSGWRKTLGGKDAISLQLAEPYIKPTKQDEDIPF